MRWRRRWLLPLHDRRWVWQAHMPKPTKGLVQGLGLRFCLRSPQLDHQELYCVIIIVFCCLFPVRLGENRGSGQNRYRRRLGCLRCSCGCCSCRRTLLFWLKLRGRHPKLYSRLYSRLYSISLSISPACARFEFSQGTPVLRQPRSKVGCS